MLEIVQLPVLSDNYVYLLHDAAAGATAAVDPAVAAPVLTELAARGWTLTHILNTHHHGDHVGGNLDLQRATGCAVVGARRDRTRIPGIDIEVGEGDEIAIGTSRARVFETPGHTHGHIVFWFEAAQALFCGDTLFTMGCGMLFEGTAAEMWRSLSRILELPDATRIYCAHEYSLENGQFALTLEPENDALRRRMTKVQRLSAAHRPTVPATLAEERATNPFLRATSPELQRSLHLIGAEPVQVFAKIRLLRDDFGD
jgi:hydroxyacylglutathione hydrolase